VVAAPPRDGEGPFWKYSLTVGSLGGVALDGLWRAVNLASLGLAHVLVSWEGWLRGALRQ
jgi:hypothetical protein